MRHNNWGYVYRTRRRAEEYSTRFFTFSCNHREMLFRSDSIKDEFALHLRETSRQMEVKLSAWVIMPNHIHLLVILEHPQVKDYLRAVKSPFARDVLKRWRKSRDPIINRLGTCKGTAFWLPGGGHDEAVTSPEQFESTVNYVHLNPVRWGLVSRSVDWPWSSAREHAERFAAYQREIEARRVPNSRTNVESEPNIGT